VPAAYRHGYLRGPTGRGQAQFTRPAGSGPTPLLQLRDPRPISLHVMMRGFMASDLEGIPVLGRVLARAGLRSLIAVGEFRRPGRQLVAKGATCGGSN
jgi:hypothetical protein